ncbi:MAG: uroporphyrinogen decarboxylase family protein [Fimbriimonas sp.]|nr:uroporphyrinogen decarboxylase family protein [Fimbriimonas sp.]
MPATSRDLVRDCLTFRHPERIPRDLWTLPWAERRYPEELQALRERFPTDFAGVPDVYQPSPRRRGAQYGIGEFVDEWGCTFVNVQDGVHGEVKEPTIPDLAAIDAWEPPFEVLPLDPIVARDQVNAACAATERFVTSGCCPRPWERCQFLRGSENALVDVTEPEEGFSRLLAKVHEFYMRELEFWVTTDVDSINFMDDSGAQDRLLISPATWRDMFKPLYREYCDMAHANGKFVFMHSDGCISAVMGDLVEIGVDAVNSQLFAMDMAEVAAKAKGKLTFWGEIDRQHVLTSPNPEVGRQAVRTVARHLYDPSGGVIAQFEFGGGAVPATAWAIFDEWDNVSNVVHVQPDSK